MRNTAHLAAGALLFTALAAGACRAQETPSAQLARTADAWFDDSLKLRPTFATQIGDRRFDDQLDNDLSPATAEARVASAERAHQALARIDKTALSAEERISYDFLVEQVDVTLAAAKFPQHLLALNHMNNLPEYLARLGSGSGPQPFVTVKDYDTFLVRAERFPVFADTAISTLKEGIKRGITHPRVAFQRVPPLLRAIGVEDATKSPFWKPIENMPATFTKEERDRLSKNYRDALDKRILPAYRKLADFVEQQYLPAARTTVGWSALPDGAAWYRQQIRAATTVDLDPARVHEIGLAEVARLLAEMEKVRVAVGYQGNLQQFIHYMATDPRFYFKSADAMLEAYREVKPRIGAQLPRLFNRMPRADYEIRAMEEFRAAQVPGGQYQRGSIDGKRPGVFYVNTHDLNGLPTFITETLTLHEASPGHHFQISIAQEIPDLPRMRRFGQFIVFGEGWALYAESLGKEMGLYADPYQWYGHLTDGMLRALRLVVDTGLHSKGWTREQAVKYMLDNSSVSQSTADIEVDRYMIWPGQALAYKTGQMRISELRARAERELGKSFDVRAFHDQVLGSGPLPLPVLEAKIGRWIDEHRATSR